MEIGKTLPIFNLGSRSKSPSSVTFNEFFSEMCWHKNTLGSSDGLKYRLNGPAYDLDGNILPPPANLKFLGRLPKFQSQISDKYETPLRPSTIYQDDAIIKAIKDTNYDRSAFSGVNGNSFEFFREFRRLDGSPTVPTTLNRDIFKRAIDDVVQLLSIYGFIGNVPILSWEEISIVRTASPGFPGKVLKSKDKSEFVEQCPHWYDLVWTIAHRDAPFIDIDDPDYFVDPQYFFPNGTAPFPFNQLWVGFGKTEVVASNKIQARRLRTITCGDPAYHAAMSRLTQAFNDFLGRFGNEDDFPGAVGIDLHNGGFTSLMEHLHQFAISLAGDFTKFDATVLLMFAIACMRIRYLCWDKKGMSKREWVDRMTCYLIYGMMNAILLPSGEIFQKFMSVTSGIGTTSYDNTLDCWIAKFYAYRRKHGFGLFDDTFYRSISTGEYLTGVAFDNSDHPLGYFFKHYSDDCVDGSNFDWPFDERASFFSELGFSLSLKDDFSSSSPLGITFLGMTCVEQNLFGTNQFVPIFNRNRVITAIIYNDTKKEDPIKFASKLSSFVLLTAFDAEFNSMLLDVFRRYCRRHRIIMRFKSITNVIIPTTHDLQRWWLGLQ